MNTGSSQDPPFLCLNAEQTIGMDEFQGNPSGSMIHGRRIVIKLNIYTLLTSIHHLSYALQRSVDIIGIDTVMGDHPKTGWPRI